MLPTLSAKELNVHPFEVYPNPVLNSMKIQMSNRATNIDQIEITNMNGNIVWTGSSESLEKEINLSALSSGSYIVKIKNKDGDLILPSDNSPLDPYLSEAFALVKQACKRLVGTSYTVK